MVFQRDVFVAFMASGVVWTIGASGGLQDVVLAVVAGAYVLFGSLALALTQGPTWIALAALWVCPMGLVAVFVTDAGSVLHAAMGMVVGGIFVTFCFAIWVGSATLLLHLFVPGRRTVP